MPISTSQNICSLLSMRMRMRMMDVDLARFWILNPKINDDVPINKETIVRTFCVRPGIRVIGVFVYCCCCPSANTKEANKLFIIKT